MHIRLCGGGYLLKAPGSMASYLADKLFNLSNDIYVQDYASPREARMSLMRYLRFYNEERPHQALEYRAPAEVYFQTKQDSH